MEDDVMMVRELKSNEFQNEVIDSEGLVLVDFSADWCFPCKMLAPVIEKLSTETEGIAKIYKIDIDKSRDIAQKYAIMSVPTVMIFKNGIIMEKMVGFQSKKALLKKLNKHSA